MKKDNLIEQPIKELILPAPHMMARLISANETYMLAGRGTFKTSRGISLYAIDRVYEMPRSTGVGVGLSFEHMDQNTIPPLLQALDEFGFSNGDHYVIHKQPPKDWPRPYLGVLNNKYDHVMTWHNGTIIYLVSLIKKASANGISAQWGFFDEVKFMNETDLTDEIFPIFRGNEETKNRFQYCSGYLSKFFATDKNADPVKIKWLLKKRQLQNKKTIDIVLTLALELNDLKVLYNTAGINRKQLLRPQINAIESRLAKLRANLVHVVEVNAYDVEYAHGNKWLKDKRRNTKEHDFNVTYLNKDPDKPGESFYPDFNTVIHTYESNNDIDANKPLIITSDYQHSIAPVPICQLGRLPGSEVISLNYVDEIYRLEPEGLQEALQAFCDRYADHANKKVYFVFDHTAIGRRVNADEYFVMVKKILKRNGWKIIEIYTGKAPDHYQKYQDTRQWLTDNNTMPIRINKKCKKLIISITGAAAISKNGETKKDKSGEQEPTLDQSETTHFSDTFDMINYAVLKLRLIKRGSQAARVSSR